MEINKQIEIPLNKKKIIFLFFICIAFLLIGLWFIFKPPVISNSYWGNPTRMYLAGIGGIFIGALGSVAFFIKLFDKKPGLIINDQGVFDNASGVAAGLVAWQDIVGLRTFNEANQRGLILIVKNPEFYLNRQKNFLKRKLMNMNNDKFDSPINIPAIGLKCNFDELCKTIRDKFDERKEAHTPNSG